MGGEKGRRGCYRTRRRGGVVGRDRRGKGNSIGNGSGTVGDGGILVDSLLISLVSFFLSDTLIQ